MVQSVTLTNFRSYQERTFRFDTTVTVVVGPNATGKTNLLEALFVLATTKSFRAKDPELVRRGESFYRLSAETTHGSVAVGYQRTHTGTEKRAMYEGVRAPLSQHLGRLQTVLFEPNDLQMVMGAPDLRRRYLDFILSQTDSNYLKTLQRYRRVLQQRNRLLAEWAGQENELFAWNIKLAELAADIDSARRAVILHINRLAEAIYKDIAGSRESLALEYRGTAEQDDYASDFLAKLSQNLSRDIGAGFTTIGPHRDDFQIHFKDTGITSVASRGEMRTVVVVLKLAELRYIEERSGQSPILLLDDVFSELDESRRSYLITKLGTYQSVITTTDADTARQLDGAAVIKTQGNY